jgi:hypothetical protein
MDYSARDFAIFREMFQGDYMETKHGTGMGPATVVLSKEIRDSY